MFVSLGPFCTPSHHPSLERMPKPQRCGGGPQSLDFFINIYDSSLYLSIELSRFAVCEALAEEMMVVGGKLAGTQLHWLALKAPTPELPWPLVQTLLQQQRVTTHVHTSIQNESLLLDTSTGSRDTFQQRYVKLQKHHSPSLSERSSSRTDRSLGVPGTRVFVSTLPKTKGEVGLRLCTMYDTPLPHTPAPLFRQKRVRQLPCVLSLAPSMTVILWPQLLGSVQALSALR